MCVCVCVYRERKGVCVSVWLFVRECVRGIWVYERVWVWVWMFVGVHVWVCVWIWVPFYVIHSHMHTHTHKHHLSSLTWRPWVCVCSMLEFWHFPREEEIWIKITTTARISTSILVPSMDLLAEWDQQTTAKMRTVVSALIQSSSVSEYTYTHTHTHSLRVCVCVCVCMCIFVHILTQSLRIVYLAVVLPPEGVFYDQSKWRVKIHYSTASTSGRRMNVSLRRAHTCSVSPYRLYLKTKQNKPKLILGLGSALQPHVCVFDGECFLSYLWQSLGLSL